MGRQRYYYGWVIVAVLFTVEFITYGISGSTLSLFFFPMIEELGWSLTQLSAAVSASGIAAMVVSPLLGRVLDRYGARVVLTLGAVASGVTLLLLMRVQEVWQYWLLFGIAGAMGMGEMGRLSTPVVVSKWFVRLRGRAMAIATSGTMVGGFVMVPTMAALITMVGWRNSWGILGIVVLLLNFPLVLLFMRREPEDLGLLPDGGVSSVALSERWMGSSVRTAAEEDSWTFRQVVWTRTLWLMVVAFNLTGFATSSVSFHQVPFFVQQGLSIQAASYILTASLLFSALSRFLWAFMVERFPVQACLVAMATFRASGTLVLIVVPYPFNAVLFVVLWGLLGGAFGLLQPMAWSNYYGRAFQGSIQGSLRPFMAFSQLGGPLTAGVLFDLTGSYTVPFAIASALAMSSVFLFLGAPPPRRRGATS